MIDFDQKLKAEEFTSDTDILCDCALTLEQRVKARQKITLANGDVAGLYSQRGSVLRDGDLIQASSSGEIIRIRAANESVSSVYINDPLTLARASYHLGNRHVALQITSTFLRYQHDHVLDDMLQGMGIKTQHEMAPFQPEAGAYGDHGHASAHTHGHDTSYHHH